MPGDARPGRRGLRPPDGHRAAVDVEGGRQHFGHLLVGGRDQHRHARDLGQERQVQEAVVAGPVVAGDPGPIDAEHHRQPVQAHVEVHLVPRPVEEGRVDGHHRPQTGHGHAGRGRDGVLLGDAHVEEALGVALGERKEAGRTGHGGCDGHQLRTVGRLGQDGPPEGLGVARTVRRTRPGSPGQRVERGHVVQALLCIGLGRSVAQALLREHVEHHRAARGKRLDAAPPRGRRGSGRRPARGRRCPERRRRPLPTHPLRRPPSPGDTAATRWGIGAAVVVENDDDRGGRDPDVVERLVGQAPRQSLRRPPRPPPDGSQPASCRALAMP